MRIVLKILLLVCTTHLFGQVNWRHNSLPTDTCVRIANEITFNSVTGTRHSNPLIIANGIVINGRVLDTSLVQNVSFLKCPEAFYRFNYAGVNGAIMLKTKQEFETVTPVSIRDRKSIEGQVVYALNGYFLADSTLQVATKAIKGIDILFTKVPKGGHPRPTIINIWTLTRKERKEIITLCRGVGIGPVKAD